MLGGEESVEAENNTIVPGVEVVPTDPSVNEEIDENVNDAIHHNSRP